MDDSERRTVKRSRFDQTEPEPKRASRFDRRSRSPPARRSEHGRDRSPLAQDGAPEPKKSPADAAAAAGEWCWVAMHLDINDGPSSVFKSLMNPQPLPPPKSMRNSRPARESNTSMFPRSETRARRPPDLRRRRITRPTHPRCSTAKCMLRMATISRTSRSMTCGTATC